MKELYRNGSTHSERNSKIDPFPELPNEYFYHDPLDVSRRHWGFAFTHASTSSKRILFAIRSLSQFKGFVKCPWRMEWIVSEMIDWLKVRDPALIVREIFVTLTIEKNQTVDPQPQDELIAWLEDANQKIDRAIAIEQQMEIEEDLRRSADWASVIQRFQNM